MRDPKRIYQVCNKLAEYWGEVPDWRFGQLLCNMLGEELNGKDLFFIEDDKFMEMLEHYFNENFPKPGQVVNNHIDIKEKNKKNRLLFLVEN